MPFIWGLLASIILQAPLSTHQHMMEVLISDQSSCCQHSAGLLWLREAVMTLEADST